MRQACLTCAALSSRYTMYDLGVTGGCASPLSRKAVKLGLVESFRRMASVIVSQRPGWPTFVRGFESYLVLCKAPCDILEGIVQALDFPVLS